MTQLLVATRNRGKMREFGELLAHLPVQVAFPPDLGLSLSVDETGSSYAENAALKARAFSAASGLIALGDDSGLEVDALGGAPGIRSARYSLGSDRDRLTTLLAHLEGTPLERRTARFRCVVAICTPGGELYTAEGTCEGTIVTTPVGSGGFGYDPIFYLPQQALTMAQLPPQVKNQVSHRARAVQAATPTLMRLLTM